MPIIKYGSDEQKQNYLPKIASGEMKLGFSITEPDAGTDTTRISTFAARDGDDYVISGKKVWSSNLQHADRTLILVRTAPYEAVERMTLCMSLFFLDLKSEGITIQ